MIRKIIAWDTSSKVGALVALEGEEDSDGPPRLVAEFTLNVDSTHSERLLWGIHQVLESARWKIEDIDVFGVGLGPGSFTGLRIGITTARTFAHTFKKPLVGISSLAALARPVALGLDRQTWMIALTDACKGELFALWGPADAVAQYDTPDSPPDLPSDLPGGPKVTETVLSLEQLTQRLRQNFPANTHWIALGDASQKLKPDFPKHVLDQILFNQIQGRFVGLLVWEAYQGGQKSGRTFEAVDIFPRYLRASDAEVKLRAGLLAPAPSFDV